MTEEQRLDLRIQATGDQCDVALMDLLPEMRRIADGGLVASDRDWAIVRMVMAATVGRLHAMLAKRGRNVK